MREGADSSDDAAQHTGSTTRNKFNHWSLVEDPESDHIEKEMDLKRFQIKKLVEECKKVVQDQTSKAVAHGRTLHNRITPLCL